MVDEFNQGGPGSSGASGGSGSTGGGTSTGGAGGGTGTGTATAPAAGQQTSGIDQLRTAYESVKKEFEPFQKLNLKPEQITQYQGIYEKTYGEVAAIGRQLGYPDAEIIEALQENPIATLDFLRNQLREAQAGQQRQQDPGTDLNQLVEQRLQEALAPINERENTRMTNEANAVFERVSYQLAAEVYKQEGIDIASVPEDEMTLLLSAASEIMKYDEDALRALKYEGKTVGIQKAFQEAKTMLDKYYLARSGRSTQVRQQGPGRPGVQQQTNGKKPTLDEMIDNPALINAKYKE